MATNIFNFDGTLLTTVADGTLDSTHATIKFPGRGYQNYGEPVLESMLWILENFSGSTAPQLPVTGQLWFDTAVGSGSLKIWNGNEWQNAGGVTVSDTAPSNPLQGALWYDTLNKQLKVYCKMSSTTGYWDIVGPLGSKINQDPVDPSIPVNSVVDAMLVIGVEDGQLHSLWRISIAGIVLCIISKDPVFTPQSSNLTNNGFPKIYPGINFNTKIPGIGISGDETIFRSTKTNLPSVSQTWNLGSPTKEFNLFYGRDGKFSNSVGVGTVSNQFNFEVAGTSKLGGAVSLGAGTLNNPPIKWTASRPLTTVPQTGAVEFDGNNFYFTGLLHGAPVRRTPLFALNLNESQNLFVSSAGGDDTNDGRSKVTPLKTIKAALQILIDQNLTGYTIFVESGEYLEQNPMFVPPQTSIVGDNLRRVIVRPVHNKLDIFHTSGSNYFYGMTFKDHRAPAFAFAFPCSTAQATVVDGSITQIVPTFSYSGYNAFDPPTVFIEPPPFSVGSVQAYATASIVNGAITDIEITNSGCYFTSLPTITITGSGDSGSGCAVVPRIDTNPDSPTFGQLLAIDVTNFGSGYIAPVSVVITGGNGVGATAEAVVNDGVIGSFGFASTGDRGLGYTRAPHISIKPPTPSIIRSSPYVQNCSSITGPFDLDGNQILTLPGLWVNSNEPVPGVFLDTEGAGSGIRVDGEVLDNDPAGGSTVIRSFVADAFTQINQGGIGHLMLNRGYAQFVSCFTTFSSVGYWTRSGGFCNISNSVIDFGDIGLKAEGYYPNPYASGVASQTFSSVVGSVSLITGGSGFQHSTIFETVMIGGRRGTSPDSERARCQVITDENGAVAVIRLLTTGANYIEEPTISWAGAPREDVNVVPTPPTYSVILNNQREFVQINAVNEQPQFGSAILYHDQFYIVSNVVATGSTANWQVATTPTIYYMDQNDGITFHDISNISSGGLALEYVGSGVTYNALPYYGGVPDVKKQVVDGEYPESPNYPGRVYYVTIDNTGNFNIGPYFSVNFVDGSVKFNAKEFKLPRLNSIGPFQRKDTPSSLPYPTGINTWGPGYADEINCDPSLTHLVTEGIENLKHDKTTLPTQFAVKNYFTRITGNVSPSTETTVLYDRSIDANIGSNAARWNQLWTTSANITVYNGHMANIDTAFINGNLVINTGDVIYRDDIPLVVGGANVTVGTDKSCVTIVPQGNLYGEKTNLSLWSTFAGDPGNNDHDPRRTVDILAGFSASISGTSKTSTINQPTPQGVWASEFLAFNVGNSRPNAVASSYFSANDDNNLTLERMRIDGWGRVGVGTGSVRNQLEIFAPNNYMNWRNLENEWNGIGIFSGASTNDYALYMGADRTNTVSYIQAGKPGGNFANLSLNARGGSVGIGTTVPLRALHVYQPSGGTFIKVESAGTTNTSQIHLSRGSGIDTYLGPTSNNVFDIFTTENIPITFSNNSTPRVTIGSNGTTYFNDDIDVDGIIYGRNDIIGYYTSDERLKVNVLSINDALLKVNELNGVTFDWSDEAKALSSHRTNREAGLIAQDVEKVLPEVVTTREDGFKAVDYQKVIPLLVEAIKELTDKVKDLESRIN